MSKPCSHYLFYLLERNFRKKMYTKHNVHRFRILNTAECKFRNIKVSRIVLSREKSIEPEIIMLVTKKQLQKHEDIFFSHLKNKFFECGRRKFSI